MPLEAAAPLGFQTRRTEDLTAVRGEPAQAENTSLPPQGSKEFRSMHRQPLADPGTAGCRATGPCRGGRSCGGVSADRNLDVALDGGMGTATTRGARSACQAPRGFARMLPCRPPGDHSLSPCGVHYSHFTDGKVETRRGKATRRHDDAGRSPALVPRTSERPGKTPRSPLGRAASVRPRVTAPRVLLCAMRSRGSVQPAHPVSATCRHLRGGRGGLVPARHWPRPLWALPTTAA